jgi:hypothetical protein
MKFCSHCGAEIDDDAVICIKCGCQVAKIETGKIGANDKPSVGLAVLSFIFPIVGLILFLVWKNTRAKRAKSCGLGALVGVIVQIASSAVAIAGNGNILDNINFPSSSKFEVYDKNNKLSKSKARQLSLEMLKGIAAEPSSVKIIDINEPKYSEDFGYIFRVDFTWTSMHGIPSHDRWWWQAKNSMSATLMDDQSAASKIYYGW